MTPHWRQRAVALGAAVWLLACGAAPDERPNLVLFVSDSLRADAIDCEGARSRTPHVCAMAERGVTFDATYAGAPWTLPSVVSMFTASHPASYARPGLHRKAAGGNWDEFFHVPDEEVLLAEALAARGYATPGFVQGGIQEYSNALQGFALAEPPSQAEFLPELAKVFPDAGTALRGVRYREYLGAVRYLLEDEREPFFLLIWVRDPHAEYRPPPAQEAQLRLAPGSVPRPLDFYMRLGNPHRNKPWSLRMGDYSADLTPAEVDLLVELYHLELQSVDDRLGRVLELLRRRGSAENTFVVFTSDHGEGFGAHGFFQHGNTLYEELLRVPLVMTGPRLPAGVRIERSVSQIDLMPTLGELVGVECCAGAQGRSLLPVVRGKAPPGGAVYAGSPQRRAARDALIEGRYKLIAFEGGAFELYDVVADPDERRDLAAARPELAARLEERLRAQRADNQRRRAQRAPSADAATLDATRDATLEQLKELGYVE